ncbi:MAG: PAS domain S-box protein [Haloferacaceae archaeon]
MTRNQPHDCAGPETGGSPSGNGTNTIADRLESGSEYGLFRHAVEQAASAIFFTDRDGTIEYVNPAFEELTGYDAGEAIGRNPRILKSGKLTEEYYERMWETILEGEVWREEVPNHRADGELYYANQTIAPITDDDGAVTGFIAVQNDVTERKTAESDNRLYETILQQLEDPVLVQDLDGRFVTVNDAVSDYAGLPREELLDRDEFAFMDAEAAATIAERKREVLEDEEPVSYEVSPTFDDTGEGEHSFSTLRYPHYDEQGDLAGTFAICRDFTQLKRRERELEQYRCAVEGAYDLIAAVDADERYLFANRPYCEFHGIRQEVIEGLEVADVLEPETYRTASDYIDRVFEGESVKYRMWRTDSGRGDRLLDVRYYPIEPEEGGVRGGVVIMRDVTEQAERNRHLQVVDRILRHNIRNELNVIRGHARDVSERCAGDVAAQARAIVGPAERLLATAEKSRAVTEVLREPAERVSTDVAETCRNAASGVEKRHPDADVDVVAPSSAVVSASSNFGDAIDELLENAVVHAEDDRPTVELRITAAADAVHVSIRDGNPSISEMDRAILEEGRAPKRLSHGSGLGLWLVYWIVVRSGGSIAVRELEPRGNLVTIELSRGSSREDSGDDSTGADNGNPEYVIDSNQERFQ